MAAFFNLERKKKKYFERRVYAGSLYRKLFRFTEENVEWIANHFLDYKQESRGGALSNLFKMQVFLRSLGDPGFQVGVGVDLGIHQTTVSRILKEVAYKIVTKKDLWISFPSTVVDMETAKAGWRIPNAVGAIDCTHIRIDKPAIYGVEYYNRKGFCSINVQATCNSKEMYTSVDASWPGSVHDSRVWRNSNIHEKFANNNYGACLLGDEGYGIAPWLLTPYKNPTTIAEKQYNKLHTKDRVTIERCFGQLKSRFPMLHYTVRLNLDRVCTYITAAFILHNVAKYLQDADDFEPLETDEPFCHYHANYNETQIRQLGQQLRDQIAEQLIS